MSIKTCNFKAQIFIECSMSPIVWPPVDTVTIFRGEKGEYPVFTQTRKVSKLLSSLTAKIFFPSDDKELTL